MNEPLVSALIPEIAMVFAAGLGTRMRPLTNHLPKPLVQVKGQTLIDRTLDDLAEIGVKKAIVNVHHLADQVEEHVACRKNPQVIISDERSLLLDQAGGIRKALPLIGSAPFFMCNTDAFWFGAKQSNLLLLAQAWDPKKMDIALLLSQTKGSVGVDWQGDFDLAPDGRLLRPEGPKSYVYSGVALIKPELFFDATGDVIKLSPYLFAAGAAGRLYGVVSQGLWLHVGSIEAIEEAERAIAAYKK
jgi:MurNAc alpha-1-phosphate uridylyltransferase